MISSELAKKLKDAGFPQIGHGSFFNIPPSREENMRVLVGEEPQSEKVYLPTPSELIEACGEKVLLWEEKGEWHAVVYVDIHNTVSPSFEWEVRTEYQSGATPEEAVANLYYEIHTRKSHS